MTSLPRIVDFGPEHLTAAVVLSASAGWSHRYEDWALLQSLSDGRAALLDDRLVGTAFRTDFGPEMSCVNMIIVAEDVQRQGLGERLTTSILQADEKRGYRLVATSSGKCLYEKLGFRTTSHIMKLEGRVRAAPIIRGASGAERADRDIITALDAKSFGGDRAALVQWMFDNAEVAVARENGSITSFATLRRFGRGHVIGPVVASSIGAAQAVISRLAAQVPNEPLRLDVAEDSGLAPWLKTIGLSRTDRSSIMGRGDRGSSQNYVALFSQGLG
ncbi:MAG: GNAT family N-acetyltransferase [Pseudomonadota bacterium]